jgi:hypothetical protein
VIFKTAKKRFYSPSFYDYIFLIFLFVAGRSRRPKNLPYGFHGSGSGTLQAVKLTNIASQKLSFRISPPGNKKASPRVQVTWQTRASTFPVVDIGTPRGRNKKDLEAGSPVY